MYINSPTKFRLIKLKHAIKEIIYQTSLASVGSAVKSTQRCWLFHYLKQ